MDREGAGCQGLESNDYGTMPFFHCRGQRFIPERGPGQGGNIPGSFGIPLVQALRHVVDRGFILLLFWEEVSLNPMPAL